MEVIKDWDIKLEIVKTRKGVLLHKIQVGENHFFLEQNPLKDSKYDILKDDLYKKFTNEMEEIEENKE